MTATGTPATVRLGFVNVETWDFLQDLYGYLYDRYETSVFVRREAITPIFRERATRWRLRRDLQAFLAGHDVVFFEWASELLALATRLPLRCRIVTRLHRYEMYEWAQRINWAAVDRVILVSAAKRAEFARRFPGQAHKVSVVPAAVSLEKFPFSRPPFSGTLGTLCHLTPRKRVYDLILSLADFLRRHPSFRLRIAGGPRPGCLDYHEALHRLVGQCGLGRQVVFDGPVADPAAWYRTIDVFVSNSYSEGLQVAPMEAMATGCYTLSHDWDGADELLPSECRFLSGAELTERIERFSGLSDRHRRDEQQRMREIAVTRFGADTLFPQVDRILRQCAGTGPR